jgi:hypothetical protein
MHTVKGSVRVCVGLARPPLNVKCLLKWSIKELAALYERFTPELAKTYKTARDPVGPQGDDGKVCTLTVGARETEGVSGKGRGKRLRKAAKPFDAD